MAILAGTPNLSSNACTHKAALGERFRSAYDRNEPKPVISVIVYGRNDNYSYALDRRTALGLNQLALQLEPGRDEIIFVDYNSDNDLPTHPEALADTLTQQAVDLIRVIRVRPEVHACLTRPGPPVREAVCRNIALRRLQASSSWVLSTNPDCLLINPQGKRLSQLVSDLPDGYFGLPRFELPRLVWEHLPRSNPEEAAKQALEFAQAFALNEEVHHLSDTIGYDAPGDFQFLRADSLKEIGGFDEAMSLGWHVDSNLNARLALRYGKLIDFNEASDGDLHLYHTEHSRRISPKHAAGRSEDSEEQFVKRVTDAIPPHQSDTWGFPTEIFEEFKLAAPPAKKAIFDLAAHSEAPRAVSYSYGPESFGKLPDASPEHLAAFLIDHLAFAKPGSTIGCLGDNQRNADWLKGLFERAALPLKAVGSHDTQAVLDAADIICLFAPTRIEARGAPHFESAFSQAVKVEAERTAAGKAPRRVIGINVPHSQFEEPFLACFNCPMTPVASRLRFGEIKPDLLQPLQLIGLFEKGPAGCRDASGLRNDGRNEGYFAMVRKHVLPGRWRLDYRVEMSLAFRGRVVLDIALDTKIVAQAKIDTVLPGAKSGSVYFASDANGLFGGKFECRIWANTKAKVALKEATLHRL